MRSRAASPRRKIAWEASGGKGRIHMNVLWEMAGAERVLHGVLEGAKGMIHGVTCGAGMPYRIAEICASYGVHYYPIVSSARAFRALWKRAYHKFQDWLGAVVYEDPWLAGGHNGLSNVEDPAKPGDPYPRVKELRDVMRDECGLVATPVVMAGGVWWLSEWQDWIDNQELGPVAFQFGTRPLMTQESPISDAWKKRLLQLKKGRCVPQPLLAHRLLFVRRQQPLHRGAARQIRAPGRLQPARGGRAYRALPVGARGRLVYLTEADKHRAEDWVKQGYDEAMRTPESTLIFVTAEKENEILTDQIACMGCLSACMFSNWSQNEQGTTGKKADPRSFCIQKTLQEISHSDKIDDQLMFAGHNAYRFASDPYYANGFIPTVKQLVERLVTGY